MKTIRKILGFTLLVSIFTFVSCTNNEIYKDVNSLVSSVEKFTKPIEVEKLKEKIDNGDMILLLDVREAGEFNAGYIPGALNIPRGVLEFKIDNDAFWENAMLYKPLKDDEIIVYCKKGKRSILAAYSLQKMGYTNVKYVVGGWKQWELTYPSLFEKNIQHSDHQQAEVGGC